MQFPVEARNAVQLVYREPELCLRAGAGLVLALLLAGCVYQPSDGAPSVKLDPAKIPDAEPRVEPRSRGGNKSPYSVFGKTYYVMSSSAGFFQRGEASWYGTKFHGNNTSNGERYDMYKMTAAHKTLPIPSYVRVRNLENGKQVIVRVNDRGPFHGDRIIDLSYAAATKIGMLKKGTARVEVEIIDTKAWVAGKKSGSVALAGAGSTGLHKPTAPARRVMHTGKPGEGRLYLQVGAYTSLDSAQSVQNRLLDSLEYNVVIHPTGTQQQLYRVRIGPLPSDRSLEDLKHSAALDAFGRLVRVTEF